MAFYKILSVLTIALAIFSTNAFSMEDDIGLELITSSTIKKKKEGCSHWGLSHWLSGIGEYLCPGGSPKKSGRYVKHYKRDGVEYKTVHSDCFLMIVELA